MIEHPKRMIFYYVKCANRSYTHFAPLVGLFVVGASFIHVPSYEIAIWICYFQILVWKDQTIHLEKSVFHDLVLICQIFLLHTRTIRICHFSFSVTFFIIPFSLIHRTIRICHLACLLFLSRP